MAAILVPPPLPAAGQVDSASQISPERSPSLHSTAIHLAQATWVTIEVSPPVTLPPLMPL